MTDRRAWRTSWSSAVVAALLLVFCAPSGDAFAQSQGKKKRGSPTSEKTRKKHPPRKGKRKAPRVKVFDFTGLDLAGRLRTPQLIYFLDRAAEELELASLEKRSFVPEMIESVDEESL